LLEVNLNDFGEHISHESNEYYPTSSDHWSEISLIDSNKTLRDIELWQITFYTLALVNNEVNVQHIHPKCNC